MTKHKKTDIKKKVYGGNLYNRPITSEVLQFNVELESNE